MSRVILIAADKSMPLCSHSAVQTKTVTVENTPHTISFPCGFQVSEHSYYRSCVDELNYPMKPYQYELELDACETDLNHLKSYLVKNLSPGDTAELWSLWVGDLPKRKPLRTHSLLSDLDKNVLKKLLRADDLRITVTID